MCANNYVQSESSQSYESTAWQEDSSNTLLPLIHNSYA